MSLQLIETRRIPAQAWRNGGGSTHELFTWPAGATPDSWQMRVSLAEITRDGPFSLYEGVDRWFAVVDGAGVVLTLPDGRHMLDPQSPPVRFDGGLAPHCSLNHRDTRDLNLMVRRDQGRGSMLRVKNDDEWLSSATLRAVYVAEPLTLQIDDADAAQLPAHTLAVSTYARRQRWRVRGDSDTPAAWWIEFEPRASP